MAGVFRIKFEMKKHALNFLLIGIMIAASKSVVAGESGEQVKEIALPEPVYKGKVSIEEALFNRRSVRNLSPAPLTLKEISQLLWAGGGRNIDGLTGATRTYPSAGGAYPVELYLIASNVEGLEAGLYRYQWKNHSLKLINKGDMVSGIKTATFGGIFTKSPLPPACIAATAVYRRTTQRYGERGRERYVPMDAGGCSENISLQATAMGLGTYIIGAFEDSALKNSIGASDEETPLFIMPIGKK